MKIASLLAPALFLALTACPPPQSVGEAAEPDESYRALGTEPGWLLTITDSELRYEGNYGETRIAVPKPEGRPSFNGWRYVTDRLTVDITHSPCSDGMSDRRYADTVLISADGVDYHGCGGAALPPESLDDTHWAIITIDGEPTASERAAELHFSQGRISGSAGCNRMSGSYQVEENRLKTGPLAMTRMACIGPVAGQENALVAILGNTPAIRYTPEGRMLLSGGDHSAVLEQIF
ncbi:MAG: META domain-containing protein [Blastomonas sp.]